VGSPRCLVCVYGLAVLLGPLKAGCVNLESDVYPVNRLAG
jgi:hypothetical protein